MMTPRVRSQSRHANQPRSDAGWASCLQRGVVIAAATAVLLTLAACSQTSPLRFQVVDPQTKQPIPHGIARVISLSTGLLALPLNEETLEEILAEDQQVSLVFIDEEGFANLAVLEGRQVIIEVGPSPFSVEAQQPGTYWARYLYTPSSGTLVWIRDESQEQTAAESPAYAEVLVRSR